MAESRSCPGDALLPGFCFCKSKTIDKLRLVAGGREKREEEGGKEGGREIKEREREREGGMIQRQR